MKKMTYAEALDIAIASTTDKTAIERLNALKASIEKRATSRKGTSTKKHDENVELAEKMFAAMEEGRVYSSAEMQDTIPELEKATPNKIAALVKILGERIETSKVKGRVAYTIA